MLRLFRPVVALAVAASSASAQHRASLRSTWGQSQFGPELRGVGASNFATLTIGLPPDGAQPPAKHSSGARLALQFLAASAGAVGGGLVTFLALRDVSETRVKGDEGYTRSGNVGYLVGSFAGATLGAQLVGTRMGGHSPIWATSFGALVGTLPLAALGVDEPYLPLFGIALGWIPQAGLAAVAFNAAER